MIQDASNMNGAAAERAEIDRVWSLVEGLDAIVWEADPVSWKFTYVSRRAEAMLGYPLDRWLKEADFWVSILHPEDRDAAVRSCLETTRLGRNHDFTYRAIAADGRVVWIRDLVSVAVDARGRATHLRGVMFDITRQRETEERFRVAAQSGNDLMYEWDVPTGRIAWFGEFEKRLGYERGEVDHSEAGWRRIVHPEDAPRVLDQMDRHFRDAAPLVVEYRVRRKDGAWRHWRDAATPVQDAKGALRKWVGVVVDVTEERRAQAEIARQKERAALLAEASRLFAESNLDLPALMDRLSGILVPAVADSCYVRRPSEDGRSICTVAVRNRDAAVEKRERELTAALQPMDQGMTGDVLRRGRTVFMPAVDEEEFRDATAPQFHDYVGGSSLGSYIMVPMRARGVIVGALGVGRTIGRAPFTQEDLDLVQSLANRAALALATWDAFQKSQEAVRAREEFLSIASHELKTPLTALRLGLQGILRRLRKGDVEITEPEVLEMELREVEEGSRRLGSLIDQLLDVSRLTAGRLKLQRADVDLEAVVRSAMKGLANERAGAPPPELVVERPVRGFWDPVRIEQVVQNLLSNALKYGEGRPVRVVVSGVDHVARIAVEDRGIGMTPEFLKNIFKAFERDRAAQAYQGLGLGLYITKQIVESHGGLIRVQSRLGQGSTFTVELPRVAAS